MSGVDFECAGERQEWVATIPSELTFWVSKSLTGGSQRVLRVPWVAKSSLVLGGSYVPLPGWAL